MPFDKAPALTTLSPSEQAKINAETKQKQEAAEKQVAWQSLQAAVDEYKKPFNNRYADTSELSLIRPSNVDKSVQTLKFWDITINGQPYLCPQFEGYLPGIGSGRYIVLPDGTLHQVANERRSGPSELQVDGLLNTISVPDKNGDRFPLISGAEKKEFVALTNHDHPPGQDIVGYGASFKIGDTSVRLESGIVESSSHASSINSVVDRLKATIESTK